MSKRQQHTSVSNSVQMVSPNHFGNDIAAFASTTVCVCGVTGEALVALEGFAAIHGLQMPMHFRGLPFVCLCVCVCVCVACVCVCVACVCVCVCVCVYVWVETLSVCLCA